MRARLVEKSEEEYEEMLNEIYGEVTICGMAMDQGRILRELDPVAFRCGLSDEPEQWECDECNTVHDTEEEATECCEEEA